MAGYSARQSSFTTGDTITAAHSNNEFNAILAAFHVSTGHTHDGTTAGDGGPLSTLYSNAISMGTGADTDIAVTFNANSNDGVITWMEDEDYFQFSDDILISSTEKIQFRDTALYVYSSTDGQLDVIADTKIQLTATTIGLSGAISGTGIADEDDMSSNSATKLATQQSIKAYVDSQVTAQDLDVTSDSGTIAIDLDSETLTVAGGTGLSSSATSNTVTLAIDSTVTTLTGSQTLTNKTLTSPVLNTGISGTAVLDEDDMSSNSATKLATQQSIKAYVDSEVGGISSSWVLEDDDGTEVTVAAGKEVKFIGSGITTNWTDTDNGTDGDPYDLTFTVNAAQTGITSILATDLKIGEDNETKIDFETANEIHFYANNTEQVYLADNIFGPQSDSDVDLGTTSVRWKDAYVDSVTVTDNVTVGGDLTVNGTTTTVNSTTVTIDDPIFTLGGDSAPGSDDNKDRGIEFRWHSGTAAKVGFFGYDDSESAFTFIPDASNSSEVFSGTVGNVIFGNIAGTLTTAAQTNITSVGALGGGSISSGFGAIDTGSSNITTTGLISGGSLDIDDVLINGTTIGHTDDTDLMTLSNGGLVVAGTLEATGNITGTLATAAQTNITSLGTLSTLTVDNVIINGTTIGHTDDTDLMTLASGGLTVAGTIEGTTITASTALVPDASGGADLGSTSLEWGDVYIADDKKLYLGSDQNFSIEYDEDGNDTTAVVAAGGVSMAPHGSSAGNGTELRFQELAANGANYVGFKAPDAIAANKVFVLPNADGSANQVLKTDGSLGLGWVDQAGGGTVSLVADGAITAGKPCILTAAGKAQQIAYADAAAGVGTAVDLDTSVNGSDNSATLVYLDGVGTKKTFVKIYCDGGSSNNITAIAFTVDNNGSRTIRAGTPVTLISNDTQFVSAIFDPDTDRVIVAYRNSDDNSTPYYNVVSVDGTTITASTAAAIDSTSTIDARDVQISYDTSADRVAVVFYDQGNDNGKIRSYVGTVTGGTTNSVAWGSNVYADTDTSVGNTTTRLVYDIGTNRHLLVWDDDNGTQSRVGTLTGSSTNTLSWGNQTALYTTTDSSDIMLVYEATQAKCVVGFRSASSTQKLGVVTITAGTTNTAAIGSLATVTRDDDSIGNTALTAFAASKIGYVYNTSNAVKFAPFTISGTSLSAGTVVDIVSADTAYVMAAGIVATGQVLIAYEDNNTSKTVIEYRSATISNGGATNLTKENYLGVAAASISDTASGDITIVGGVNENQSSLTIGRRYFTNAAGTVGLAGDDGGTQFLGTAVTATKLQLEEDPYQFYAIADGALTRGKPIEITSDGKIKALAGSDTAVTSTTDFATTHVEQVTGYYDPDIQRIVIFYNDGANSSYVTGRVGTVTGGTTNSISWGTATVVYSNFISGNSSISSTYDTAVDRGVVQYKAYSGGTDGYGQYCNVITATGGTTNTIAVGAQNEFRAAATTNGWSFTDAAFDVDNSVVGLIGIEENAAGSTQGLKLIAGKVTGGTTNTISFGSVTDVNGSGDNTNHASICYAQRMDQFIISYKDTADGSDGTIVRVNVSDGASPTTSLSTETDMTGGTNVDYSTIEYMPAIDRQILIYTVSGQRIIRLHDNNGSELSENITDGGTSGSFYGHGKLAMNTSTTGTSYPPSGTANNGRVAMVYRNSSDSNAVNVQEMVFQDNSGGGTWDGFYFTSVRVNASTYGYEWHIIYDASAERYVTLGRDTEDSNNAAAYVITPAVYTTKTSFDGFAQYAVSDAETVAVKLDYMIDDNQSDLTVGSTYYIDSAIALTTTSTNNQKVGVAVGAEEIQIIKT